MSIDDDPPLVTEIPPVFGRSGCRWPMPGVPAYTSPFSSELLKWGEISWQLWAERAGALAKKNERC